MAQPIPLSTFSEMIEQYHHRLMSMEADLQDRARSGFIPPKAYTKRVTHLQQLYGQLRKLKQISRMEDPERNLNNDVGLPVLEDCTPTEKQICERYLGARLVFLQEVEAQVAEVHDWVADISIGKTQPIRTTLRLSKLRKLIRKLDFDAQVLQDQGHSLKQNIDAMLKSVKNVANRNTNRSTVEALMSLFQGLDRGITKIAKLKTEVNNFERKSEKIKGWLQGQFAKFNQMPVPIISPPSPITTAETLQEVQQSLSPRFMRNLKRQKMVERFWEEVVSDGEEASSVFPTLAEPMKANTALDADQKKTRAKSPTIPNQKKKKNRKKKRR